MKILKLLLTAVAAWAVYWLRRRRHGIRPRIGFLLLTGLLCNLPVFLFLLSLINRKMVATEALGFMATFAVIGAVFGLGFTWVQSEAEIRQAESCNRQTASFG